MVQIKGFENYRVTEDGKVWSEKSNKFLTLTTNFYGYKRVVLYNNKKKRDIQVHILVAECYLIKPKYDYYEVNHKDGNKINNHYNNLEWVTKEENLEHARLTGLNNSIPPPNGKGERNSRSKLTELSIISIRNLAESGNSLKDIASLYNVSASHVSNIVNRKKWNHI